MQYVLTNMQMRASDDYTIRMLGIPSETLMERAGEALAKKAMEMLPSGRVLCVCGGGNNGGDGFICARILRAAGYDAEVVCIAERFSGDCQKAREKYTAEGGKIYQTFTGDAYGLIIDCLLGTGFQGALSEPFVLAVKKINDYKDHGVKVLSADIPSGVNGDNGGTGEVAVRADATVCMGEYKAGVLLGGGIDCAGEITRANIGIALPERGYAQWTEQEDVKRLLPMRKRNSHKGSYGTAAIVAGSAQYTGAAYLSMGACLRAGAGYTVLFTPKDVLPYFILQSPEALLKPLCTGSKMTFHKEVFDRLLAYDAIAYGMGLGNTEEVAKGAKYLLKNYTGKLILDASALDALATYTKPEKLFQTKKCDVVITPHVKEFSRLTKEGIQDILERGLYAPVGYAKACGINVYLKNAVSLLTDGEEIFVNTSGNSGQAKGGSGDVLSGVMASLCAQGLSTLNSARVGGYLVGRAAEIATRKLGEYALVASDIIENLGAAFLEIQG